MVNVFFGIFVNFGRRFGSDQGGWASRPTSKIANYGACASGKRLGSTRGVARRALTRPQPLGALFAFSRVVVAALTPCKLTPRFDWLQITHVSSFESLLHLQQVVYVPDGRRRPQDQARLLVNDAVDGQGRATPTWSCQLQAGTISPSHLTPYHLTTVLSTTCAS